jgi:hypothetical protein
VRDLPEARVRDLPEARVRDLPEARVRDLPEARERIMPERHTEAVPEVQTLVTPKPVDPQPADTKLPAVTAVEASHSAETYEPVRSASERAAQRRRTPRIARERPTSAGFKTTTSPGWLKPAKSGLVWPGDAR